MSLEAASRSSIHDPYGTERRRCAAWLATVSDRSWVGVCRPRRAVFLFITLALHMCFMPTPGLTERARDLGIPFSGQPGPLNSITDVSGVSVGHTTLISGDGALRRGQGPIRTGVTIIHPRDPKSTEGSFGGWFTLNASGEMTGTTWLQERGIIDGPIAMTNTHSVGIVRDSLVAWMVDRGWPADWHAPIVAETYDGALNDINGQHLSKAHVFEALESASSGRVAEGSVGGGTGMICNGFKGGIGTASRLFTVGDQRFTLGVIVQCNYNWDGDDLRLGGQRVADQLSVGQHCHVDRQIARSKDWYPYCDTLSAQLTPRTRDGSIIVILATDAPLLPHQLTRLAKRPSLALGRLGAISTDGSGDIFLAFSTAQTGRLDESKFQEITAFPNYALTSAFRAAIEATEEAIVNAMVAASTMIGADGFKVEALPHDEIKAIFGQ
jgi:D-aminopeptidase